MCWGGERGGIITGRWRLWLLLPSPCTADPRTGAGGRGALAEDAGSWGDRYNNTTEHVDKWVWPPPLHSLPVVARQAVGLRVRRSLAAVSYRGG